jgi:hypothetical protein
MRNFNLTKVGATYFVRDIFLSKAYRVLFWKLYTLKRSTPYI